MNLSIRSRAVWGASGLLAATFLLASCVGDVTDPALADVTGDWCTIRGLDSTNLPGADVAFIGMVLLRSDGQIVGSGSVSRPGDPEVIPSRYQGTFTAGTLTLDRTDLETDRTEPGPFFTLTLQFDGRDLVGTATGDQDFAGPVHMVRLGPRCFAD